MNKEINLCMPTIRRLDLLINCIKSAIAGRLKPTCVHVCDNGDICDALPRFDVPVKVFNPGGNYGVGRSWNRFLHICNDYIIICNDDVEFLPDTIEKLVTAAERLPKEIFLTCEGPRDWNWALFLQRKRSLLEIGEYDGFFYPAYYEDSDYRQRMLLKGYKPFIVPGCKYGHHGGASAKALVKTGDHVDNEEMLEKYYHRKWGGSRYLEKYQTPFDLKDKCSVTINTEDGAAFKVDDEDALRVQHHSWYNIYPNTISNQNGKKIEEFVLNLADADIEHINGNFTDNRKCNLRPRAARG